MRSLVAIAAVAIWLTLDSARAAEPFSWTGLYLGVHAGTARSRGNVTYGDFPEGSFATTFADGIIPRQQSLRPEGMLAGFLGGYRMQSGAIVLGFEVDLSPGNLNGSDAFTYGCGCSAMNTVATQTLDWLTTVRGTVGYAPVSNWLLFATAGLAVGRVESKFSVTTVPAFASVIAEGSGVRTGLVYGGGTEFAFTQNVTARFEYLRYDLGSDSISAPYTVIGFTLPLGMIGQYRIGGEIVRAALIYRFN